MASTLDLEARGIGLYMLGIYTEAMAFACLCEAVVARDYSTSDQVSDAELDLLRRWDIIQSRSLPSDVHRELRVLLTSTLEVLRDLEVRLPKVVTLEAHMQPASVLSYYLYTTDADLQTLVDLNCGDRPLNPMLYNGPVKALLVT
jgi:hypothetical protein